MQLNKQLEKLNTEDSAAPEKPIQELLPSAAFSSLGKPLIQEILQRVDPQTLSQARLVNRYFNSIANELVSTIHFGAKSSYCGPLQLFRAFQLWPAVTEIKLFFNWERDFEVPEDERSAGDIGVESLVFSGWTNIQVLQCYRSGLGPLSGSAFAACSQRWANLREIHLKSNRLQALGVLAMSMGTYESLRVLNLSANGLGEGSGKALGFLVARCPALRELDISWNQLIEAEMQEFIKVEISTLESIDVSRNQLLDGGGALLGTSKWPRLKKLTAGGNYFKDAAIEGLAQGQWPLLEELSLTRNQIGEQGAETLSLATVGGAPRWPRLKSLNLHTNFLQGKQLSSLFLGEYRALTHLDLSNLEFGVEGALALALAAHFLPALKNLNVYQTKMYAEAIQALFAAPWAKIERLHLGGNDIGVEGVEALVSAMEQGRLPSLKALEFRICPFKSAHWEAFLSCSCLERLKELRFTHCGVGKLGVAALVNAAERLSGLSYLSLHGPENDHEYGGSEGADMLVSGRWTSLTKVSFSHFPGLLGNNEEWREASMGGDESNCTLLERT